MRPEIVCVTVTPLVFDSVTHTAVATFPAGTVVSVDSLTPSEVGDHGETGIFAELGFPHDESDSDLFALCQPEDVRRADHLNPSLLVVAAMGTGKSLFRDECAQIPRIAS